MTPEQEAKLKAAGRRIAEREPWQPATVAEAFLAPGFRVGGAYLAPLTMRAWLRLDAARSPFVAGKWPRGTEAQVRALGIALEAICGAPDGTDRPDVTGEFMPWEFGIDAAEGPEAMEAIDALVRAALDPMVAMEHPRARDASSRGGGFGWWLWLYEFLTARMPRAEAMDCPVAEAWALRCAALQAAGWRVTGTRYCDRGGREG